MKRLPEEFNLGEQSPLHRPPHTRSEETGGHSVSGKVLAGEPSPRQELFRQGADRVASQWCSPADLTVNDPAWWDQAAS